MTGLLVTLVVLQSLSLLVQLSISGSLINAAKSLTETATSALKWTGDALGIH